VVLGWLRRANEAGVLVVRSAPLWRSRRRPELLWVVGSRTATGRLGHRPSSSRRSANLWAGAMVDQDRTVGVVRDGNLISALPNFPVDFAMETLVTLGLYDRCRVELLAGHLKGDYVEELYLDG
jgi:hypothetical protein